MAEHQKTFNIISTITGYIDDFERGFEVSPGYWYSQPEVIKTIDLYWVNQFKRSRTDEEGRRKHFLNTSRFRSEVASKMIQIKVANFVFNPEWGQHPLPAFMMSREFRNWAKDSDFAKTIDRWEEDFPKYGTIVGKKTRKRIERVAINSLRNDPRAQSLAVAKYVIEEKDWNKWELIQNGQELGWDVSAVESYKEDEDFKVYEAELYVPRWWIAEQKGKKDPSEKMIRAMVAVTVKKADNKKDYTGDVLFAEELQKSRYCDEKWREIDGRWLGFGIMEQEIENQISANETNMLKRRALYWTARKIFQSVDKMLKYNLVKDVRDGDILGVGPNGLVQQVPMETRGFAEFVQEERNLDQNSDRNSFTFEVTTGESLPSGTPFRLGVVLTTAAETHFTRKRARFADFLRKVVVDYVLPEFRKSIQGEHFVHLAGTPEDIDLFDAMYTDLWMEHKIAEYIKKTGFWPRQEDIEEMRQQLQASFERAPDRRIKLPADYYKNIKYKLDLNLVGEYRDIKTENETIKTLITSGLLLPENLQNPITRRIIQQVLQRIGMNLQALIGRAQLATITAPQRAPARAEFPQPPTQQGTLVERTNIGVGI